MFKDKSLKYILLVSIVIAVIIPLINIYLIYPAFSNSIVVNTEDEAIRLANHLKPSVLDSDTKLKNPNEIEENARHEIEDFNLMKLKVFEKNGEIIYSTDSKDIGKINKRSYFHEVVAKGQPYTKVVQKDTNSLEGQVVTADVVETYVPIMVDGDFIGAFEIYYDITDRNSGLGAIVFHYSILPMAMMVCFLVVIFVILSKADVNIIKRKEAEMELMDKNEEFRSMNEELKTSNEDLDMAKRELEKTNNELVKSNSLKDLFTDIMRHDLLNPAGIINTYSQFLIEDYPDNDDLKIMVKSSNKLIEMIEAASAFSKIENLDKVELYDLNLKNIIADACDTLKPAYEQEGIELICKLNGDMPIKANTMIEDVFLNFLSNALKYAPNGKKVIIEVREKNDNYLVSVMDFGDGIPDENKDSIFERFSREAKGAVKGTGLGLAIVARLVELHNGRVWIEDNPEGGSVFIVELPKFAMIKVESPLVSDK